MSSPFLNPREQKPPGADWARLIPGETATLRGGRKKPAPSVKPCAAALSAVSKQDIQNVTELALALLTPDALRGRGAGRLALSTAGDCALVALNWLLVGALLVPLRTMFPYVRVFGYAAGAPVSLLGIALLHAALITLIGHGDGLYVSGIRPREQTRILAKCVLWATAILCCACWLQSVPWPTCGLFGVAGVFHFGAMWARRWQSWRQEQRIDESGDVRNVLIVGAGGVGRHIAACVQEHPHSGRKVYGFLDNERPAGNGVIGRVGDLARVARLGFVDEVILAAPRDRTLALEVLREARRMRLDVAIVPELFGCKPPRAEVERVGDMPLICLHAEHLPAAGLVLKRVVDVLGAGLVLTALSPLLAVIAGLIKLDSRGSVFYRAPRVGKKGRLFRCYKFRTMVSNADDLKHHLRRDNQRSGPFFKIVGDPRITRFGRFLRRYSLDELPQLWNVLKGDMSLVGPRPHPVDDFATYEIDHLARLDMMPGMTGLWQVTARRDPSFQRGMELDRKYIRTWSLSLDVRILIRTFLAVLQGSGE